MGQLTNFALVTIRAYFSVQVCDIFEIFSYVHVVMKAYSEKRINLRLIWIITVLHFAVSLLIYISFPTKLY